MYVYTSVEDWEQAVEDGILCSLLFPICSHLEADRHVDPNPGRYVFGLSILRSVLNGPCVVCAGLKIQSTAQLVLPLPIAAEEGFVKGPCSGIGISPYHVVYARARSR